MPADLVGSRTLSDCDVRAMNAAFLVEQLTVAQSGRAYSLRHLREITGLPVTRLGVSSSNRRCTAPDGDAAILHGLDAAWNAGLRFFDPQRRHFRGTAEHLFGMGLHDRGGQSGSYTVLSRLGTMAPPPGSDRDGTADLKPENLLLQWHAVSPYAKSPSALNTSPESTPPRLSSSKSGCAGSGCAFACEPRWRRNAPDSRAA
mmetsp:Transcript_457/g.999  ORF Transcript_457/g.999 Transcript_457/m.999 type:complete len:202 (-) Transcript_457:347-952(-)